MGVTEARLAEFVTGYSTDDIPDDVMLIAKRGIMNFCGVALYAAALPPVDIFVDLFGAEGGNPVATVLGKGYKTSALNASLVNGFLGHYEDYDDTHDGSGIHPASPIVPAPLAVTEMQQVAGRELLAAYAVGVEVACRVGTLIASHFRDGAQHWHITNTCGVLGAAAAAGRLLGLTPNQMVHTFAVAGTQSMGVRELFGSMGKPFHAGKSAHNGLLAAMLVQRGFTGTDDIFEGPRGLVGVMSNGGDVAGLAKGLGSSWELHKQRVEVPREPRGYPGSYRRYPCPENSSMGYRQTS